MTTRGSGRRDGWAVPGRAPRSRDRASGGTGQATVRIRTPPARTWATGPSSSRVRRCPAPEPGADHVVGEADVARAFTVRSTSIASPDAAGSGGGPRAVLARGEAGQVAGVEPGRQSFDPVAVEQDVDLAEPGPEAAPRPTPSGRPRHPIRAWGSRGAGSNPAVPTGIRTALGPFWDHGLSHPAFG